MIVGPGAGSVNPQRLGFRALRELSAESGYEVTSDQAMAELAARLRDTRIDTLIANAGILGEDSLATLDLQTVREQVEVNALGPLRTIKALLHPGYVRTDMTDHEGMMDAYDSARLLLRRIDDLTLETSGGFWHANGERLPW